MHRYVTLATIAVVVLMPLGVRGQDKEKPQAAADKIDKKVVEIVKQTGDLYKNAKTLQAEGTIVSKVTNDGESQDINVTATYAVEKPKHFAVKTQVGGDAKKGPDVVADGKNLIIFRKALNQYTEQESPKSLGEIGLTLLRIGPANTGMLFANILADDPADLLMEGVNSCSYAGMDKVDGTSVHRMKFSQNEFDWELWVAAEGKPYILRMISTGEGPNGKFTTTETYKNWKLDAASAKDTFTFTAPKDATKVKAFERVPQP